MDNHNEFQTIRYLYKNISLVKKLAYILIAITAIVACQKRPAEPAYAVQVSLGGWNEPHYQAADIIDRLKDVNAIIPLNKVIIGWSTDTSIYKEVGKYLHDNNIQMFLWLPVFAETEEVCESTVAVDLWGNVPSNYDLTAGEGFRFNCPTNPENAAKVINIYDKYFAGCGFDGVFLDRIRTQSFVGGAGGPLSCGCPECVERFKAEGIDIEAVKQAVEAKGDSFFSVTSYTPEQGFTFEDPLAAGYFKAKGHIVSGAVAAIADSLRSRGLQVGMDLYAPFMAPFVGQDYSILSTHADFIKPMLYRMTFAPAGMGFEYDLLKKALPGATGYPGFQMDIEFLHSQLEAMETSTCAKFPGIEINHIKDIAPTSPEYVSESLKAVMSHGFEGAVLSWNIMEAPDAHLEALRETK